MISDDHMVLPDLWETGCNVLAFCDCLDCVIILIDWPMALFAERGFFIDERSTWGRLFPSLIQLWHKTKKNKFTLIIMNI